MLVQSVVCLHRYGSICKESQRQCDKRNGNRQFEIIPMTAQIIEQRSQLRKALKSKRNSLTADTQSKAADKVLLRAQEQPEITASSTIGIYFSVGAELHTMPLINYLLDAGKYVSLPVLHPFCPGHLLMLNYKRGDTLHSNRLRIPEPALDVTRVVPLTAIDTLLIPLVGFDSNGNRLGMGGGFYDRTLQCRQQGKYPNLSVFGLAHDCQHVEQLPAAPWDIPVDGVLTPSRCWRFK